MKLTAKFMAMLLMLLSMSLSFTSCSDDNDQLDNKTLYDFSIVWDVVDRGDYTTANAQQVAANLTASGEYIFEGFTETDAIELFDDFCQQMRYQLSTGYTKITLLAKLTRIEGNKVVTTKTFYIDPNGTTIKAPARAEGAEAVVVVE